MAENTSGSPPGIPSGGQFAPSSHAEPGISLTKTFECDPDQVAKGILNDLRDTPVGWIRELLYGTHKAVAAGETTYEEFLDGLIAKNHGGHCKDHEHNRFDTGTVLPRLPYRVHGGGAHQP